MIKIYNSNVSVDTSAYNCLGILLGKAAVQLGSSYQMMVKGGWTFGFDEFTKDILGKRMACHQRTNFIESFVKYHDVMITKHDFEKMTFIEEIKDMIAEKIPIIVNTDSFWCPWSFAYQKRNYLHSFRIIDFCDKDNMLIGEDPYITEKQLRMQLNDIYPGIRNYFTIHKRSSYIEPCFLATALKEDIIQMFEDNIFDSLYAFAEAMKYIVLEVECDEYKDELYAAPIIEKLKSVTCSRRGYSYMIQYIARIHADFDLDDISVKLFGISENWERIRGQLIRYYLKGDNQGARSLFGIIHRIIEEEKAIADSINKLIESKYNSRRN